MITESMTTPTSTSACRNCGERTRTGFARSPLVRLAVPVEQFVFPDAYVVSLARTGFSISSEVKDTGTKGLGLFTKEFVPKGKVVWRSQVGRNMMMFVGQNLFRDYLATLDNHEERRAAVEHSYVAHGDVVMVLKDEGKFMNHSDDPNTFSNEDKIDRDVSIAARDIEAGEELTCDYSAFIFPEWYIQLHADYEVPLDYFSLKPAASEN
jgi:hypothetical protein